MFNRVTDADMYEATASYWKLSHEIARNAMESRGVEEPEALDSILKRIWHDFRKGAARDPDAALMPYSEKGMLDYRKVWIPESEIYELKKQGLITMDAIINSTRFNYEREDLACQKYFEYRRIDKTRTSSFARSPSEIQTGMVHA